VKWFIEIAPEGQAAPQVPQPLHSAEITLETLLPFSVFISMALYGHRVAQIPQPAQASLFTEAVMASGLTQPLLIGIAASVIVNHGLP